MWGSKEEIIFLEVLLVDAAFLFMPMQNLPCTFEPLHLSFLRVNADYASVKQAYLSLC